MGWAGRVRGLQVGLWQFTVQLLRDEAAAQNQDVAGKFFDTSISVRLAGHVQLPWTRPKRPKSVFGLGFSLFILISIFLERCKTSFPAYLAFLLAIWRLRFSSWLIPRAGSQFSLAFDAVMVHAIFYCYCYW